MTVADISIQYLLMSDGEDVVVTTATDNSGKVPPLVTMLGLLELAKEQCYTLAAGEGEPLEEDDGDA